MSAASAPPAAGFGDPSASGEIGSKAHRMLDALAACTDEEGRITRLSFGPAHRRAVDLVQDWMRDAGLSPRLDAAGTVRGRSGSGGPRLLIGSHIDTVPDAGRFDGMLGVVVGILAVELLRREGVRLPFDVEVLAFGDEEGLRFPGAAIGSLSLARALPQALLDTLDEHGVSLGAALTAFGAGAGAEPDAGVDAGPVLAALRERPEELIGYLEVHVEQGPVLEESSAALGVVTAIAAAARLRVCVGGVGGHAGTVPMRLRRDALAAAAEMIGAVEALATGPDPDPEVVATVGELTVDGAAANAIPSRTVFTVDARSPRVADLARFRDRLTDALRGVAERRGVELSVEVEYDGTATVCDPHLMELFDQSARALGAVPPRLASGAGHDAQSMAEIVPVAMLFVRCRDGVSHVPAEYASPEDVGLSVLALAGAVARLGVTMATDVLEG